MHPSARAVFLACLSTACSHTEPFGSGGGSSTTGPFDQNPPVRLTYSTGVDLAPGWGQQTRGWVYSYEAGTADGDICLGALPEPGGTRRHEKCEVTDPGHLIQDVMLDAAESPTGRLAWVATHMTPGVPRPLRASLRLGTWSQSDQGTSLRDLPYLAPGGQTIATLRSLLWLGSDTLVGIGADLLISQPMGCPFCKLDTVLVNPMVVVYDLRQSPATEAALAVTAGVTSVSSPDGSSLVFTRTGDSRVINYQLATGDTATIFDFGGARWVRDASRIGTRLWAIVDGWPGQSGADQGGSLAVVDLTTGLELVRQDPTRLYRHAIVAPSNTEAAAEGSGVTYINIRDSLTGTLLRIDTLVSPVSDLWLLEQ